MLRQHPLSRYTETSMLHDKADAKRHKIEFCIVPSHAVRWPHICIILANMPQKDFVKHQKPNPTEYKARIDILVCLYGP